MTTLTEGKYTGDVLLQELPGSYCREAVTIAAGADLSVGSVLSRIKTAASAAKAGGNTGNGVLTLTEDAEVITGAVPGIYTLRCIAAATNSGTFRVTAPDGVVLGDAVVGTAFANRIGFTIADGATDFIVGDGFDITVTAGNWTLQDPAATDGSRDPEGILLVETALAADAAVTGVALVRGPAMVRRAGLIFGAGVDNLAKRNAVVASLEALGIQVIA